MNFNRFAPETKLTKPINCCVCGKQKNNIMDSHNPEPLAKKPNKICNVCNENAVALRLQEIRKGAKQCRE